MLPHIKNKIFSWHGIDQYGQATHGKTPGINAKTVKRQLFKQAIMVTNIRQQRKRLHQQSFKMTTSLWIQLIEQWLYGLRSQLPLNQTLALLVQQHGIKQLNRINSHCLRAIQKGHSLHHALCELKHLKPLWLIDSIAAGEHQGDLCRVFSQIQSQLKQQCHIRKSLKKALLYPASVLVISLLVSLFLLLSIIPQFQSIYSQMNAKLPWVTLALLQISRWLSRNGSALFIITTSIFLCCAMCYKSSPRLQRACHRLIIKTPKVGLLIMHQQLARWYGLMALLLEAGLAMDQALERTSVCFSNHCFTQMGQALLIAVKNGHTLSSQQSALKNIPHLDQHLLHLGESTGQLSQVFKHLGEQHIYALNQFCDNINQWLEPSIMIILALLIGGMVIAMYAPIMQLGNIV